MNDHRVPNWFGDLQWSGVESGTCEFRTQSYDLGWTLRIFGCHER